MKQDDRVKAALKRKNWEQILVAAKIEHRTGVAQLNLIVEEWLKAREARKVEGKQDA
jgi:pyruvate kinase